MTPQLWTTLAFSLMAGGAVIAYDILAFQTGATATISQLLWHLCKWWPFLIYIIVASMGGMTWHIKNAFQGSLSPGLPFWAHTALLFCAFVAGYYVASQYLWQSPGVD